MARKPTKVATAAAAPTKRERVLSAATKLFLREGYGATGMDAIAKEADVSKATVYSYYPDKASLFADVMVRMCDEVGGHGQAQGLITESPEETLRAIALYGLHRVTESIQRRIFQHVVAESKEFPELGRKFWEAGPGRIQGLLTRYLEEASRQGVLAVSDPARAAELLVGQITGLYVFPMLAGVRKRPTEDEMRRDVDRVVAGFLSYSKATR